MQDKINAREIIEKYDLKDLSTDELKHQEVNKKWGSCVGENWYGYALDGCPAVWANVIDDFLTQLKEAQINFTIQQIKLKFGGLRFYISFPEEVDNSTRSHINKQIAVLEHALFHESLIF